MDNDRQFPNLTIINHPLIQHKLTIMRQKDTSSNVFRQLLKEITYLMGYEITRDLPLSLRPIETPLAKMKAPTLAGKKQALIAVLRAGLGMIDGLLSLMPAARIGHIGLYRDENKRPVEYLVRLPSTADRMFIVCDPMIATGYSAAHAVDVLIEYGVDPKHIKFLALVVSPEGMAVFHKAHPEVEVFAASLDDHLDEHAYIVPGLGDAGDRLFGTK